MFGRQGHFQVGTSVRFVDSAVHGRNCATFMVWMPCGFSGKACRKAFARGATKAISFDRKEKTLIRGAEPSAHLRPCTLDAAGDRLDVDGEI